MLKFLGKCRKFLEIWGGDTLCPEIFRSLKVCYPEKMPLYLSAAKGGRLSEKVVIL